MSLNLTTRHRSLRLVAGLVAGASLLLAAGTIVPADAAKPAGSRARVMLENVASTGDPAHAINSGWWGHEGGSGPAGTGSTYLSLDASNSGGTVDDASVAALLAAMGTDDFSKIAYAIVPTSADGSNETPTVTAGEDAASAFSTGGILFDSGFGQGLAGTTNANDSVAIYSTHAQLAAWVAAGVPDQGFDSSLVLHDTSAPGSPTSTAPKGKSILDAWPAGTALSLVAYVTDGSNADLGNKVPNVAVGPDGKAKTAWMPFTTVASPTSALRTSAGYQVVGAYAPTVSLANSFSGTTGMVTGTVKNKLGATATDATGSLEFAQVVGGVDQTPTSVPVSAGKATLSIPNFTSGSKTYDVTYVPDAPAQGTYLSSAPATTTITAVTKTATKTALAAVGGATDTLTATVTPKIAGKVVFKDGATTLATVSVSTSTGQAKFAKKLAYGKHVLTATFTPTSASYATSTASATRYQGTISTKLSPAKAKHGARPKVTVKITAGVVATGKVTIVFDPPTGPTKKFVVTLKNGSATLTLPKTVKGKTKVSALYGGGSVLAINGAAVTFTAT